MLYYRALLFICLTCSSVYLLIPNSQFIFLPFPFLFLNQKFVFYVCESVCFVNKFICNIFQIPYTRDIKWYLCFSGLVWSPIGVSMLLQMAFLDSFLWAGNIPLWNGIFSICLSVDGPLGCFRVLAIVNRPASNIGAHESFPVRGFVISGYMPVSWIHGSCDDCTFIFLRSLFTVFHMAALIYIPTHSVGGFPFLHTLSSMCYS